MFVTRNVLFDEDHFPYKIQEESNNAIVKGSHIIIDSILQDDGGTSIGEESCEESNIREGTSPNEMEIASSCLR